MDDFKEVTIRLRYASLPTVGGGEAPHWHLRAEMDGVEIDNLGGQALAPIFGAVARSIDDAVKPVPPKSGLPTEAGFEKALRVSR